MKITNILIFTLLIIGLGLSTESVGQVEGADGLNFKVEKVWPPISISRNQLKEVKNIVDIHPKFEVSWVREYISVDILAIKNGKVVKAKGLNSDLTDEQIELMNTADVDQEISVNVKYIPENNLVNNTMKENNFTFILEPEQDAVYRGGMEALSKRIKTQAIDKIPASTFCEYQLAVVEFSIDTDGKVIDTNILFSSNDETVDQNLLETISNLPAWKPAQFDTGVKVKQNFAMSVGDPRSCASNLINFKENE